MDTDGQSSISEEKRYMSRALQMAKRAFSEDEVPVGAVLVRHGEIIAEGYNQTIQKCDPTAHAELVAIRSGAHYCSNHRLIDCELYVTIEPCAMCVGAMLHARIKRVVFGADEPRAGALQSHLRLLDLSHFNHSIEWKGGMLERECGALIKQFFRARRRIWS